MFLFFFFANTADGLLFSNAVCNTILSFSVSDVSTEPQLSQSSCRASIRSRPFAFHLQTGRKGGSSMLPCLNSAASWPVFSPSHIIKGTTGGHAGGSEIVTEPRSRRGPRRPRAPHRCLAERCSIVKKKKVQILSCVSNLISRITL